MRGLSIRRITSNLPADWYFLDNRNFSTGMRWRRVVVEWWWNGCGIVVGVLRRCYRIVAGVLWRCYQMLLVFCCPLIAVLFDNQQ
jgi:hypothetical protein